MKIPEQRRWPRLIVVICLFFFKKKKNILKSKLYSDKNNVISLSFYVHTTLYLFAFGLF